MLSERSDEEGDGSLSKRNSQSEPERPPRKSAHDHNFVVRVRVTRDCLFTMVGSIEQKNGSGRCM